MQGKCSLRQRYEETHHPNKYALFGARLETLAHFMIRSREKNSERFILSEGHELPVAAREGHRHSHSH